MKKIKHLVFAIISFSIGAYMLWTALSVILTFNIFEKMQPMGSVFSDHLSGYNFRVFLFSSIGGAAFVFNGLFHIQEFFAKDG